MCVFRDTSVSSILRLDANTNTDTNINTQAVTNANTNVDTNADVFANNNYSQILYATKLCDIVRMTLHSTMEEGDEDKDKDKGGDEDEDEG
ncbi:hypothetical protein PVK06_024207 [Gossypium arboreum]|uniref:Uncharacterized protein n=1 Tax=Gossypium arboreum TaxID=29729 RepID=A0ABR0PD66_GOSAR|nr:hypothetical protein PVK06_024207 [Gossypium arboreum]